MKHGDYGNFVVAHLASIEMKKMQRNFILFRQAFVHEVFVSPQREETGQ
jgi:hypothetical protein